MPYCYAKLAHYTNTVSPSLVHRGGFTSWQPWLKCRRLAAGRGGRGLDWGVADGGCGPSRSEGGRRENGVSK